VRSIDVLWFLPCVCGGADAASGRSACGCADHTPTLGESCRDPLPDPQTPEEFFARARQLSDLEASGIPFHLKATYVASGDAEFTGNGTYEEWWQSKDLCGKKPRWRLQVCGDSERDKHAVYGSSTYVPLRIREVMGPQISHLGLSKEREIGGFPREQRAQRYRR